MTSVSLQNNSLKRKSTSPRRSSPRKESIPSSAPIRPQAPVLQSSVSSALHPPTLAVPNNKQSKLIELLQCPDGATLTELINATDWQAHSIRGVISGVLRKKLGLHVISIKSESGESVYRIETNGSVASRNLGEHHEETPSQH